MRFVALATAPYPAAIGASLPDTPHVNGSRVPSKLQQQLWWSVPSRHDQGRIVSSSFTTAPTRPRWWLVVRSGESKVGDLQDAPIVDEEVCS